MNGLLSKATIGLVLKKLQEASLQLLELLRHGRALPDCQHTPSSPAQSAEIAFISGVVSFQLVDPILAIGRRYPASATMVHVPKTTADVDDFAVAWEHPNSFANQLRHALTNCPARFHPRTQDTNHRTSPPSIRRSVGSEYNVVRQRIGAKNYHSVLQRDPWESRSRTMEGV